jgi:hypothetical protein
MDWAEILTSTGLVLFGFALALGWDVLKSRRARRERDDALLFAALAEIDAVRGTVGNNQNLVVAELDMLSKLPRKTLLNPLDPVEGGFWDVVKHNPPQAVLASPEVLGRIRDVSRRTAQVTEMIRSREMFRVTGIALSNYEDRMQAYDQLLRQFQGELLDALDELKPALESVKGRAGFRRLLPGSRGSKTLQRPD